MVHLVSACRRKHANRTACRYIGTRSTHPLGIFQRSPIYQLVSNLFIHFAPLVSRYPLEGTRQQAQEPGRGGSDRKEGDREAVPE